MCYIQQQISLSLHHPMTLVSAGDVGLCGLNSSHAALIPCSCDEAVKSIRPDPSSLHFITILITVLECIGP